jgi:pimeloyl-ACP methyl ester carboxylesterase
MLARILRALIAAQLILAVAVGLALHENAGWPAPAAGLAGLVAALAVHLAIIAADFAIARMAASPVPPQHAIGRWGLLRVLAVEFRDSLLTFSFRQAFLGERPLPSAPSPGAEGRLPVVLVHGYFCNRALWRPFARWLAARGHPVSSVNLEPVFGSIDDYAPTLARAIDALREATGHEQVALVCHSMGGLAARAYLRAHGDGAIARVVTLGTPHRGTVLARLGRGANARQMRPDSAWLKALAAGEPDELRALFTVVLSHHDNIVSPQAYQTLPGARTVEVSAIGHISLALDRRIWGLAAEALDRPSDLHG